MKWCANLITYPFTEGSMNKIQESFDNNPTAHSCYQNVGFLDEKYMEKEFIYKDEMWGGYYMAIQK